jgi:hypothetical protein
MRTHTLLAVAVVLTSLAVPALARADCAAPERYQSAVNTNTVVVCAQGEESNSCPEPGGMLRVDVATGGVAKLPSSCVSPPSSLADGGGGLIATSCYEDECVPPGTYQYGFAVPYPACSGESCGTEYAVVVTVTSPLASCASDAGALTDAGSAPWDAASASGGYVVCPGTWTPSQDAGHVVSHDAGLDAASHGDSGLTEADAGKKTTGGDAGHSSTKPTGSDAGHGSSTASGDAGHGGTGTSRGSGAAPVSSDGGCSTSPASTQHTVLAIDALALAFGISVLARRRARRSR